MILLITKFTIPDCFIRKKISTSVYSLMLSIDYFKSFFWTLYLEVYFCLQNIASTRMQFKPYKQLIQLCFKNAAISRMFFTTLAKVETIISNLERGVFLVHTRYIFYTSITFMEAYPPLAHTNSGFYTFDSAL